MRKYVFSSAVITGGILLTGLTANAAVYEFRGAPSDPAATGVARTDTYPEAGFGFYTSPTANQQLNELGFYVDPSDSSGSGVTAVDHTVTLYEYGGNSANPGTGYVDIAQAVIPAGSAPDSSGYAWVSIPTINLNNNGQNADYYILTFSAGPDVWYDNSNGNPVTQTVNSDFGTLSGKGWTGNGAPGVGNIQSLNVSNVEYFDANIGFSPAAAGTINVNAFNWVATAPSDFLTGSSWDQGVAPSNPSIHLATISNGGTATISNADNVGVLDLYVGDSVNTISTGSTNGNLVQTGGTLSVTNNLAIGNAGTGVGNFNLSGGTVSANNLLVGGGLASTTGGIGSVTQTGGSVTVANSLIIGNEGGTGSYNISAGSLTHTGSNNILVSGSSSAPSVLSIGGSATFTTNATTLIGNPNPSGGGTGILNISGNASYTGGLWAGIYGGTGIINITGGSVVTPSIVLGFQNTNGAYGILNLSGGSVVATTQSNLGYTGGTGIINLSGTGSFNQSNGFLSLAVSNNGSINTYFTLNQSGGTLTDTTSLTFMAPDPGTVAVWNISGGVANTYFVIDGYKGIGTLNISGSAQFTASNAVNVASDPASVGTLNLNGGTLTTPQLYTDHGAATVNFNGGVLIPYSNNDSLLNSFTLGQVNALAGGAIINTNGFNATITSPITSPSGVIGGLVKLGAGTLQMNVSNSYTGQTNVSAGQLVFAAPGALPQFTSLTVGSGATATAALFNTSNPKNSLFVSTLSLSGTTGAWTGTVDLGNNDMVVRNGSLGVITNQAAQGYARGIWLGNAGSVTGGIISTAAAADSTHLTALGVIQNSLDQKGGSALMSTFDGQSVVNTDILVKYTYYGDANLDGKVDGSDYSLIDNTYNTEAFVRGVATHPISGWYNGDFNYDSVVDGSDYTLIDNAFNSQGAQISAQLATATAQIGGSSAVPEPALFSILATGALGLLGRHRRFK